MDRLVGRAAVCGYIVGACGTARKPLAALGLGLAAALRVRSVRDLGRANVRPGCKRFEAPFHRHPMTPSALELDGCHPSHLAWSVGIGLGSLQS
jgi:hypothetical protein